MRSFFLVPFVAAHFLSPLQAVETDYAFFVFDNGETNMLASMFTHALEHDKEKLDSLNFRIVFFGAASDQMTKEPFSQFPQKLIHYKQLGVTEDVDHRWKRESKISEASLKKISSLIQVKKKVWVGVSTAVFEQLLDEYKMLDRIECVALRDSLYADGDTDYFAQAKKVQQRAGRILVPSKAAAEAISSDHTTVVGHPPLEQWEMQARGIDSCSIIKRLGLDPKRPIIVYTGAYGDFYPNAFRLFLETINHPSFSGFDSSMMPQVIVIPHPRYKGVVEEKILKTQRASVILAAEFANDPTRQIKTVEALAIADLVITSDATSTVVAQACALKKKVALINPARSVIAEQLAQRKVLQKVQAPAELAQALRAGLSGARGNEVADIYTLMGIPRNSAKILWEDLLNEDFQHKNK